MCPVQKIGLSVDAPYGQIRTELIFPSRRDEPCLSKRGLVIAAIVFILASIVAWYSWTHRALHIFYPGLIYQPPLLTIVIALAVIVVLVIAALGPWSFPLLVQKSNRPVPRPWLVGLIALVLGLPWFVLIFLHYGVAPSEKGCSMRSLTRYVM